MPVAPQKFYSYVAKLKQIWFVIVGTRAIRNQFFSEEDDDSLENIGRMDLIFCNISAVGWHHLHIQPHRWYGSLDIASCIPTFRMATWAVSSRLSCFCEVSFISFILLMCKDKSSIVAANSEFIMLLCFTLTAT